MMDRGKGGGRANRPVPLPTVCVPENDGSDQQPPLMTPQPLDLLSPLFTSLAGLTPVGDHHRAASTSMLYDRWFTYRNERTSSSSSDSGVCQASPPVQLLGNHSVSPVVAVSPPGLSPLTFHDSAFSTPTPSHHRRPNCFTFDHVPSRRPASDGNTACETSSAFDLPGSSRRDPSKLSEILIRVRGTEEPANRLPPSTHHHPTLQRKTSVIQTTGEPPVIANHLALLRTGSLPVSPHLSSQLSISVPTNPIDSLIAAQMKTPFWSSLYESAEKRHCLLTPSMSSPLSSKTTLLHVSPVPTVTESSQSPSFSFRTDEKSPSITSLNGTDDDKTNYFCGVCNKDFKRPDILSRHTRRHTGEKPFRCDCCGRWFSRSDHLTTHRRTHTDEKPYECTICPYAARRRDVLTRHMSTRHHVKAGRSVFQKKRDVRRTYSDGDQAFNLTTNKPPTSRRRRLTTNRSMNTNEYVSGSISDDFPSAIPLLEEIEDDVIVDMSDEEEVVDETEHKVV